MSGGRLWRWKHSALSCALFRAHRSCDGWAGTMDGRSVPCYCRCHEVPDTELAALLEAST